VSTDSLLKIKTVGKKKEIVCAISNLSFGTYWHPTTDVHPCLDRAFVAVHPRTDEHCLILIQDNINATGFAVAVAALNQAAQLLQQYVPRVLCIANVVGASQVTIKQGDFNFPHILVRDTEIHREFCARHPFLAETPRAASAFQKL